MPNKTIYIKESDLPLFEQAQEQLGDSISSVFADFLRERVASITPEESRIIGLLEQLKRQGEALVKDRNLPRFLEAEYAEAEAEAQQALKCLRSGKVKRAKVHFYAATAYRDKAERDLRECRALSVRITEMLKS